MTVLITAWQVIVGPAGDRIRDGAALVEGDVITAAGRRATVAPWRSVCGTPSNAATSPVHVYSPPPLRSPCQRATAGSSAWESQFTATQLRTIVDEAHGRGLPVAAHAHSLDSITTALDAGVDTIEHCTWMVGGVAFAPRDAVLPLVDRIAEAGIAVCLAHTFDWQLFARLAGEDTATELLSRPRWMADHGVNLVAGTDAGLAPFTDTGLQRATEWGFDPREVLDMATTSAAHALGLGERIGSLRAGFSADLLVVDGDPLNDLAALDSIELLMARGRLLTAPPRNHVGSR